MTTSKTLKAKIIAWYALGALVRGAQGAVLRVLNSWGRRVG